MADKRKNTSRPASQAATRATPKTNEKDQSVKSISAMARDERKNAKEPTKEESTSSVKSIGELARDERKNAKEPTKVESKASVRNNVAALRSEPKKDHVVQESRVRRDTKEPSWLLRFRNSRVGRFVFDAYYELRHKVTWPTFEEARNMTLIVIALSGIIGAALALVDFGLYHLFLLISGGK